MKPMDASVTAGSTTRQVAASTRVTAELAELSISDSGPGIPGGDRDKIFAPFFTTKETGMGMGLAIARTIIESHGGRIWADPRPGHGAILRFTLPLARSARAAAWPASKWTPRTAPAATEGAAGADLGVGAG